MKALLTLLPRPLLPAAVVASLLLSGCNTGLTPELNSQELPQYALSTAEQTWATPYRLGEEWRFRNARGYERRYQVKGLSDQQLPGMVTGTKRVGYYQQALGARLERVDSSYVGRANNGRYTASFGIAAAVRAAESPQTVAAQLDWGGYRLVLPAANDLMHLPAGVRLLPTAQLGGRTYSNVLEYSRMEAQAPGHWQLRRVYYAKEYGVVRFEEAGGDVWTRQ